MTTTTIVPQVEKSIRYDRESRDYCCQLLIDGEPISVGYASTYSDGETWCNDEYYRILQDGVMLPSRDEAVSDSDPLVPTPTPDAAPTTYGPEIDIFNAPKEPISTLADGSTVYGQFDTDASHLGVCALTAGWYLCANADGSADVFHHAQRLELCNLTRDALHALKALVNSGAIEHLLACGAAWEGKGAMPAPQAPDVQVARHVCDDEIDARYDTEIGTMFTCGADDTYVELYFPDPMPNRPHNTPELVALGNSFAPEAVEQALPNIIAVLNDSRVQQRRRPVALKRPTLRTKRPALKRVA